MIDLKFDRVSKKYRIRQNAGPGRDGSRFVNRLKNLRRRAQDFWALRDVSFEVPRGAALGIIGPNGAGKSTILKLLSNITSPTSGEITINGNLAALIEVGSGFHPELTGRENIFLSGSILGMRRREIARKLDDIIAFAEIGEYVDVPVKWYSSGMYVRLGFSISAHLDPDILLLDEVLAVGDAAFQAKCLQRITELKRAGTTIVYISHDLVSVEQLCDRIILMERGAIVAGGSPREVVAVYQEMMLRSEHFTLPEHMGASRGGPKLAKITDLYFKNLEGRAVATFRTGDSLVVRLAYSAFQPLNDVVFDVFYYSHDGRFLQCQHTTSQSGEQIDLKQGTGVIEFTCPVLGLQPGLYHVGAIIKPRDEDESIDWWYGHNMLNVEIGKWVRGNFYMPHEWQIIERDEIAGGLAGGPSSVELTGDVKNEGQIRPRS
jgi:ABC-type polysaccharide/polyol phosphate transport system ATPase subunit